MRESAKHEAVHMLVDPIVNVAYDRCVTTTQIKEATESTVRRIQRLLK